MAKPAPRRMRSVVAVFLAALGCAGLVVAAGVRVPDVPAAGPVAVPWGRIGDRLEYAVERSTDGAFGSFRVAIEVGGLTQDIDRWGSTHGALELLERQDPTPLGPDGVHHMDEARRTLDLASRDQLRDEWRSLQTKGPAGPSERPYTVVNARFGPMTPHGPMALEDGLVWAQGRKFALGESGVRPCALTQGGLRVLEAAWSVTSVGMAEGPSGQAPAVRVEKRLGFSFTGPLGSQVSGWRTDELTLVDGVPYPIAWTHRWSGTSHDASRPARAGEEVRKLVSFSPGSGPIIPWGGPSPLPCGQAGAQPERTNSRHPEDGWPPMDYPLAEALSNIEADQSLVAFRAWRTAHPDARLVGFNYRSHDDHVGQDIPNHYWYLWFASGAEVVTLTSEMPPGSTVAVNALINHDVYVDRPPVDDGELPSDPETIAHVGRLWSVAAIPETRERGLQATEWGVNGPYDKKCSDTGFCDLPQPIPVQPPTQADSPVPADRDRRMQVLTVGRWEGVNPQQAQQMRYDFLRYNLTTDQVDSYTAIVFHGAMAPPGAGQARDSGFRARPPPSWVFEAWVLGSTSLLVVATSIAFAPAAKALLAKFGVVGGYAKIQGAALLENGTRSAIVQLVHGDPGISPPELARRIHVPWSTLMHHLRTLERDGLVTGVIDGRHKRLFAATIAYQQRGGLAVLRNATTQRLFGLVQRQPGISQSAAARGLGITPQGVSWHVERLVAARLVARARAGREVRLHPTSTAVAGATGAARAA